jgi:CBS domain-containing protein
VSNQPEEVPVTQTVADVMTRDPITLAADASVVEAAQVMREADIDDVVVCDDDRITGIVTDRDLVVRALADARDARLVPLREVLSPSVMTVTPDTDVDDAIRMMREHALRRLPVVDGDRPVGIVSLGGLAIERDRTSALGDISAASPNA